MRRHKLLSAQKKKINVTICNGKALSNSVTLIENPSFLYQGKCMACIFFSYDSDKMRLSKGRV